MNDDQNRKTTFFRFQAVKWIYKHLGYLCFVIILGVVYIANVHSVEKKQRRAIVLKKELKELNYEYMQVKNKIVYDGVHSQVAERVKDAGLKTDGTKVKRIEVTKSETDSK